MSRILNGRGVSARFDSEGVRINRSGHQVDIPLPAIQEVRAAAARTVEIVSADGTAHRVEDGNPTATTAFVAALTAVLPEEPDPAGRAVVTDTRSPRDWRLNGLIALAALLLLAFLGYAVWVALTEAFRRILPARRGITVPAEAVGTESEKKVVYEYTDADGAVHRYACKRKVRRIHVAYDPHLPTRAVHADWLPFVVGRVLVLVVGSFFWLFVGVVMIFGMLW